MGVVKSTTDFNLIINTFNPPSNECEKNPVEQRKNYFTVQMCYK